MDLIYYGPLFWSVIPVKDQKGFVLANTKRGLGSIKNKISGKLTEDRIEILVRQQEVLVSDLQIGARLV